jgi:outer membrane protein TolC
MELASLNRTAAKYHRQAVQADYFPKINSSYRISISSPGKEFQLYSQTAALPLLSQNRSIFSVTVRRPVTPLFKVHEAVKMARADERVAQAKVNAMMTQILADVEHTISVFSIAQGQQTMAEIEVKTLQPSTQLATFTDQQGAAMPNESDLVEALRSL